MSSETQIGKIIVGNPAYKVRVNVSSGVKIFQVDVAQIETSNKFLIQSGTNTRVLKIVVGSPVRTAVIATDADIDEIIGVNTSGALDGAILVYNDSSGEWEAVNNYSFEDSVIDGKVYPGNLDRQKILIRRSGTAGDPVILRTGELAYSWLEDPGTNGFGNGGDRLYIGVGLETDSAGIIKAERVDTIGGRYFTNLLNHQHGILTASSAVIVDSNKRINEWFVTNLEADSAKIINLNVSDGNIITSTLTVFDSAFIQNLTVIDSVSLFAATITNLIVTNQTNLTSLLVDSESVFRSTILALDSVTINSNLTVTGITNLDSTNITYLTVNNLIVDSSAILNGSITLTGNLSGSTATFTDSVSASTITASTLTDGTILINSGTISSISGIFTDSVTANVINSTLIDASTITDGTLSLNSGIISGAIDGTFSGTLISSNGIFDSITTNLLTVLDSATIGTNLSVGDTLTTANLFVQNTTVFDDSVNINGNLRVDGSNYITNGTLYINGVSLDEIIDSDVALLLHEGEAIDIIYSDDSDKITISAELATFTNLGVASFGAYADSAETIRQFAIADGAVRIAVIDGGFFAFDSSLAS